MNNDNLVRDKEREEKTRRLAAQAVDLFRDTFAKELMYLAPLIYLMKPEADEKVERMETDGEYLYYNPAWILSIFSSGKSGYRKLKMFFLHILAHCMLGHIWDRPEDRTDMDSSYDVAAGLLAGRIAGDEREEETGMFGGGENEKKKKIRRAAAHFTAQTLRDYCAERKYSTILQNMGMKQKKDNHDRWERARKKNNKDGRPGTSGGNGCMDELLKKQWVEALNSMLSMMPSDQAKMLLQGLMPGAGMENISAAQENRSDYRELLRSYMLLKERRIEDPDMIDTDWYTLGLSMYGNIPIIEFPESSETPVADDIVIAIDTSGSCSGETASRFLRETCNMIRDMGIGRERVNIRILECDASIENEIVIHSEDDLPDFGERQMHGFGGTSFVPVFQHIDRLLEEKEMNCVRCLLYLSDTYGEFPESAPQYDTVFVVPEEDVSIFSEPDRRSKQVPEWVKMVVLTEDDLKSEDEWKNAL